jgi:uncharacterized protein YbjT (DUF2867 family)
MATAPLRTNDGLTQQRTGSPPIIVTGGTGTLGRLVVSQLRSAAHDVRVLSRHDRPSQDEHVAFVASDLATGEGAEAALQGGEVVIHCAGTSKGDEVKAQHLVKAAARAGVRHVVYISVVGADRVPIVSGIDRAAFGYFGSKYGAERVIAESGVSWTTLRATQFHDLVFMVAEQLAKLPVVPVFAGVRFQPVDTGEVAARLVELARGDPAGLVPDIAGPRIYTMAELVRSYLRAQHIRRLLVPLWMPGRAAAAVRAGATLAPDRAVGRRTWEDYLATRLSR